MNDGKSFNLIEPEDIYLFADKRTYMHTWYM